MSVFIVYHDKVLLNRGVKPLLAPSFVDAHRIDARHRHIAFVYFGVSSTDRVKLHTREHSEFRRFSKKELKNPSIKLTRSIYFYCIEALKKAQS